MTRNEVTPVKEEAGTRKKTKQATTANRNLVFGVACVSGCGTARGGFPQQRTNARTALQNTPKDDFERNRRISDDACGLARSAGTSKKVGTDFWDQKSTRLDKPIILLHGFSSSPHAARDVHSQQLPTARPAVAIIIIIISSSSSIIIIIISNLGTTHSVVVGIPASWRVGDFCRAEVH